MMAQGEERNKGVWTPQVPDVCGALLLIQNTVGFCTVTRFCTEGSNLLWLSDASDDTDLEQLFPAFGSPPLEVSK